MTIRVTSGSAAFTFVLNLVSRAVYGKPELRTDMLNYSRFAFAAIILLVEPPVMLGQQWHLVTPVKDNGKLGDIKMTDPVTGYAIDEVQGSILSTNDGGIHWARKANNLGAGGMPRALWMWDNDRGIIAANSGKVYRTIDGFNSFLPLVTIIGVTIGNCTAIHFENDTLGFIGTSTGKIFRSADAGATWTLQNSGITSSMERFFFVNDQLGFAVAAQYILRSTDGGSNWEQLPTPFLVNIKDLHFRDAMNGIGVGSVGVILRTVDGGDNWTSVTSPTTYSMADLDVQGNVLVACGAWGRIIRSTDGGVNWTEQTSDNRERLSLSFTPSGIGLMGAAGAVYRSTNMGATWSVVHMGTPHSTLNKVSFANDQTGVTVGTNQAGDNSPAGMRSVDGGRHWASLSVGGLGVHLRPDGAGSSGGGVGANTHTADYYATTQAGSSAAAPQVVIRCTQSFTPTTYIVAGGNLNGGFYRTTTGGSSWTYTAAGDPYDMYFPTETMGYAAGEGSNVYKTIDAGLSWNDLGPQVPSQQFTVFFLDELRGWTGGAGAGSRTIDGGVSWTTMGSIPSYTKSIIFTDADTGYAVGQSGQTVRSVDGGVTWVNHIADIFNATIGDAALVDGALIAVANNGDIYRAQLQCPTIAQVPVITEIEGTLYSNSTSGNQWYNANGPIIGATDPAFVPTAGGLYHVVVTDALGCVSASSNVIDFINTELPENASSATLTLFPNPAQQFITLALPTFGRMAVEVMDMHGRIVLRTSLHGANTIDIADLPSGIYTVRCTNDGSIGRFVKE